MRNFIIKKVLKTLSFFSKVLLTWCSFNGQAETTFEKIKETEKLMVETEPASHLLNLSKMEKLWDMAKIF